MTFVFALLSSPKSTRKRNENKLRETDWQDIRDVLHYGYKMMGGILLGNGNGNYMFCSTSRQATTADSESWMLDCFANRHMNSLTISSVYTY